MNSQPCTHHRPQNGAGLLAFAIGAASLLWLLARTGMKPSRAAYPCQKAAMANASAWLGTLALPGLWTGRKTTANQKRAFAFVAAAVVIAIISVPVSGLLTRSVPLSAGRTVTLNLTGRQLVASTYSDIFAVQGTTGADGGFQRLVDLMAQKGLAFSSLIGSRDVVIIKVNSQWDQRGGTNTDLVKSIIEAIVKRPGGFSGEIVIADNGQAQYGAQGGGGSLAWKENNALDRTQSMQKVADSFAGRCRVSTSLWDRITTTRVSEYSEGDLRDGYVVEAAASPRTGNIVSYPKFTTPFSTHVSFTKGIWDPTARRYDSDMLKVINVPVLKSHSGYGVTASVKHYMGVGSDKLTHTAHRSVGAGGMGTEMAGTRVPVLNVIDAIWINANPGRGPWTSYDDAAQVNVIAAGRDPVALDYWAAKNILVPAAQKLGYTSTDSLDPDVTTGRSFGSWLRLSMQELERAGIPATIDMQGINITVAPAPAGRADQAGAHAGS